MRRLIVIILAIVFLIGCASTQPKYQGATAAELLKLQKTAAQNPGYKPLDLKPQLIASEVAVIIRAAILDIEKLGCEPEFLSERGSYIWVRCYDEKEKPVMKVYQLQKLIDGYVKQKKKGGGKP